MARPNYNRFQIGDRVRYIYNGQVYKGITEGEVTNIVDNYVHIKYAFLNGPKCSHPFAIDDDFEGEYWELIEPENPIEVY